MVKRILAFLFLVALTLPVQATMVAPVNFEDLVMHSDRIFLGTVTSIEDEAPTPKRPAPALVTRFRVDETYFGQIGSEVVVRQLGTKNRKSRLNLITSIPLFRVGEKVVLFLPKESSIGYATPVGFGQGVFRLGIPKSNLNQTIVSNGPGNQTLFQGIRSSSLKKASSSKGVALTLGDLKSLISIAKRELK